MFEKFNFKKFNPTEDTILYANTMLAQILDLAPADSRCVATMTKVGNNYFASMNIVASSGHFKAEAKAQDPRISIDILDERIKLRIREWQNDRRNKNNDNDWFFPQLFSREPKYA